MTQRRPLISDDDLVLEFADVFRASGSLLSAVLAVANMARRKRRTIVQIFAPTVVETARYFGVEPAVILGDARESDASEPRHVAMWVGRQLGGSWPKLAREFERDPSTVRSACARVERNPELLRMGQEILERVLVSRGRLAAALGRKAAA